MARDPESAFLGTGWSFPPTFSRQTCSVNMVSDDQDIQESLWILFSTTLGERILLPQYGCQVWQMVFRNLTTTLETEIEDYVRQAVLYWEARIEVIEVSLRPEATVEGLVLLTVSYAIRQTNARNNLVYPFYLLEGTLPVGRL